MRVKIIYILLLIIGALACNKDKFATRPSLEVKKIENNPTSPDTFLALYLNYTDREGDINGAKLSYLRIRTNIRPITNPGVNDQVDTVVTEMPEFTPNIKGEIKILVPYAFMNEDPTVNDSMVFKIVLTDLAGNASDTLLTPKVVAKQ